MSGTQKKRTAFVIYASTLDLLEKLPEEKRKDFVLRIIEYGLSDEPFEPTEEESFILGYVFEGIDNEKKKYRVQKYLENLIANVMAYRNLRLGITENEWETAIDALKKLKGRAHREVIENIEQEVRKVLSPRVLATLRLESPYVFEYLKKCIALADSEARKTLDAELNHILQFFYFSYNKAPMPSEIAKIPHIIGDCETPRVKNGGK